MGARGRGGSWLGWTEQVELGACLCLVPVPAGFSLSSACPLPGVDCESGLEGGVGMWRGAMRLLGQRVIRGGF